MTDQPAHTCTPTCEPDAAGAVLCPNSDKYWRLPQNRSDGQPYREVTVEESYAAVGEERR